VARSPLGLVTGEEDFTNGLELRGEERSVIDETYRITAFKKSLCHDHAECLSLTLAKGGRVIKAEARAYDDGGAVRLTLEGSGTVRVKEEATGFAFPGSAIELYAQKYIFTYEDEYHPVPRGELWQNAWAFPALARLGGGYWAMYAEAPVYGQNWCGGNLSSTRANPEMLKVRRAPDQLDDISGELPFSTPWRVALTGSLADIVQSNLLENLNPPSIVEDESFIKPGKVAWHWEVENDTAKDPDRLRDWVDYAAAMGYEYCLADVGWPEHVDVPELVAYAAKQRVGIWIWKHSAELRGLEIAESQLKLFASWGVKGIKIDFFESDSQERIAQYAMLARLAAKYRLMLVFHGCSKPTGTSRVWPHVLSYEGVMGGEYLQGFSSITPGGPDAAHNCTLPFTRNAVGPMDYTPLIYSTYRTGTTDTHQTALTVIFLSYAMHLAEKPEIVLQHQCRGFLEKVPSAWDETIVLEAMPAAYVTIARRSGREWFVAGICARHPRNAIVKLDFLEEGPYTAELWADDISGDRPFDQASGALPDADEKLCAEMMASRGRPSLHGHDPHAVRVSEETVRRGQELCIPLSANGGFAMRLYL
jgi:alpha-glucosidase